MTMTMTMYDSHPAARAGLRMTPAAGQTEEECRDRHVKMVAKWQMLYSSMLVSHQNPSNLDSIQYSKSQSNQIRFPWILLLSWLQLFLFAALCDPNSISTNANNRFQVPFDSIHQNRVTAFGTCNQSQLG